MAHHAAVFPTDICRTYGSRAGDSFDISAVEVSRSQTQRTKHGNLRRLFAADLRDMSSNDRARVSNFAKARDGSINSFHFQDWTDFHSFPNGAIEGSDNLDFTSGDARQVLGSGDGAATTFQIQKHYPDADNFGYSRRILAPEPGSVRVWVAGALQAEGTDYAVEYVGGRIVFNTAVAAGSEVAASFKFYCVARFGDQASDWIAFTDRGFNQKEVSALEIVEDIDRGPMLSWLDPGGTNLREGASLDFTGTKILSPGDGLLQLWNPTTSGARLRLWDTTHTPPGRSVRVRNLSTTQTITLQDFGGTTIVVIGTDSLVEVAWTGAAWFSW